MLLVWVFLATGCTRSLLPLSLPSSTTRPVAALVDRARMQGDEMNFADDLITAVADVYGQIESRSDNPRKTAFVQNQKIDIVSGALENAVNAHPFAGLMDTVVLVTFMRQLNEDPANRELLGGDYAAIATLLQGQEAASWQLAARYLSAEDVAELKSAIDSWHALNPQQRYAAHVHLIDFLISDVANQNKTRNPGSIFSLLFIDPLAGIDPAVREIQQSRDTAERMFFYMQRLPMLVSWRVESQYQRMLAAPQVAQVLGSVSELSGSSAKFVNVTAEMAKTVETFRSDLSKERELAIDQLQHATQTASEAAITQATTRVSAERDAAVAQLTAALNAQQQTLADNTDRVLNRSIDHFYSRLQHVAIVGILTLFGSLIVYRFLMRNLARRR